MPNANEKTERNAAIRAAVEAGLGYGQASACFGITRQRIEQICRGHTVRKMPRGNPTPPKTMNLTLHCVRGMLEEGWSQELVAKLAGVSVSTLARRFPDGMPKRRLHSLLPYTGALRAAELYRAGHSLQATANLIGSTTWTIRRALRQLGEPVRMGRPKRVFTPS